MKTFKGFGKYDLNTCKVGVNKVFDCDTSTINLA